MHHFLTLDDLDLPGINKVWLYRVPKVLDLQVMAGPLDSWSSDHETESQRR